MNGRESRIPYPWLVFNEKVKVNSVFLRDSTGVSDSVLLLFGGNISQGPLVCFLFILMIVHLFGKTYHLVQFLSETNLIHYFFEKKSASENRMFTICGLQDGHLKMLGGYLEFFMKPDLASLYLHLKKELEELIQSKVRIKLSLSHEKESPMEKNNLILDFGIMCQYYRTYCFLYDSLSSFC